MMSVSGADTDALICAYRLSPNGALGLEVLELLSGIEQPVWLHFNVLDNRARRYFEKIPDLDEEGRDMLLGSETRIQARVLDDGFIVILGDLHHDLGDGHHDRHPGRDDDVPPEKARALDSHRLQELDSIAERIVNEVALLSRHRAVRNQRKASAA